MLLIPHCDITTPRLDLIAITPAMLQAEQTNDGTLSNKISSAVPSNWPPVDWEPHVLDILLAQYQLQPHQVDWHRYAALRNSDGTRKLIGVLGAFQHVATPTECEVGYTILPPHEGKGLATEAIQALIHFIRNDARQQPRLTAIIAHTFPRLPASMRILEKCGFLRDGDGADTIRYRLLL